MDIINIALLVFIVLTLYFFIVRPGNKENERKMAFLEGLERGDAVIMISGLYGHFHRLDGDKIIIETDERGHKLTFLKNAVAVEETRRLHESNNFKKKGS